MSAPRRIGVLGGMGPEATVLLMSRVIAATPAKDDADHLPLMVDMNPQVPSRIARLIEGRGEDPGPVLAKMAAGLQQAGAQALAMPCNTAHHYAPVIRDAVTIPLLDMVELSVAQAVAQVGRGGLVGILGSPALQQVGVFDRALARHDCKAVYASDQDGLLRAIRQIKQSGPSAQSRAALADAAADVAARGAALQLVACTEFSLIADAAASRAAVLDTLDVLVAAMVEFAR
ncbi:aspartate/glutamate racemase family protein [Paracoccus seriniphilus]|uniref:Aspartate racemase n=1 Tax=Paracoccus seriniphilus TaxID=184748 RepID=A0A239Q116_9RHOB|nr:amino acid racemase [Paracoccus seriniphilus]WCR16095.1 aspartate/glutamate racemase family protein [Paracoccus seriniphilus]SNT76289.1 aspartate racemase [Paracoccus seriniphilus]